MIFEINIIMKYQDDIKWNKHNNMSSLTKRSKNSSSVIN